MQSASANVGLGAQGSIQCSFWPQAPAKADFMPPTDTKNFTKRAVGPLFLVLIVVGLITLWSGVSWINRQAESQGLEEMRRQTSVLALLFARHADSTFRTVDLALKELRDASGGPPEAVANVIETHLDLLSGAVVQAGLIDAQGMVTYTTPIAVTQPTYAGDLEFFGVHEQSGKDELFVGRPIRGRVSGKWSIHLSRPILKDGKFDGIAFIAVDPDYFVNFYQSVGLGHGGAARMIRDTGEVMARSSEQDKFVGRVLTPSPYADPGAPLTGSFRRKAQVDGVDRLSSYNRLEDYGVTVVIGPSVDEQLAVVRAHQQQLIWAAGIITFLMLGLSGLILLGMRRNAATSRAIERSESKFRLLVTNMTEGLVLHRLIKDRTGRAMNYEIVGMNPAFEKQTGIVASNVVGKLASEAYGGSAPPWLQAYAEVLRTGLPATFDYRFEPAQKDFVVHLFATEPEHFATLFVDVTEQKRAQALRDADHRKLEKQYQEILKLQDQLQQQALHDPLTSLNNRRYLDQNLPREFARAKREGYALSFILLDLDHFKSVNDSFGHAFGDVVLLRLSAILQENLRESDIVCRFGGEEFLLVMPRMTPQQAEHKANTIRQIVEDTVIEHEGISLKITISAGVATYPVHGKEAGVLIKLADDAMYEAKKGGRNRVFVATPSTV